MFVRIVPLAIAAMVVGMLAGVVTAPGAPLFSPERPGTLPTFSDGSSSPSQTRTQPPPSRTATSTVKRDSNTSNGNAKKTNKTNKNNGKGGKEKGNGKGPDKSDAEPEPQVSVVPSAGETTSLVQERVQESGESFGEGNDSSTLQE